MTRSPLSSPSGRSLHLLARASSGQSESRRTSSSRDRSRSASRERPRTRYSSRRRSSRSRARDRSDSRSSSRSRSPRRSRSRSRSRSARRSRSCSRDRHAHAHEARASDGVSRGDSRGVVEGTLSSPTRSVSSPDADREHERQLATRHDGPASQSDRQRPAHPREHRSVVPSEAPQQTTATPSGDEMGATRGQASPRQRPTQPTNQDPHGEQSFRKRKRLGNTKLYWNGYEYTRATVTSMKTTYRCSFYRRESCTARLVYLAGAREYDYGNLVPHTCTRRIQTSASFRPAKADVSALMEAEVDHLVKTQSLSPAEVWYAVSTKFLYGAAVPVFGLTRVEVFKRFENMRLIYCGKCIHGKLKAPRPAQEDAQATLAPQPPLPPVSSVNSNVPMPSSPPRRPSAREPRSPSARPEGSFEVNQENFFSTQANSAGVNELGMNPTAISAPHGAPFPSNEPTVLFTDDPEAFHYHMAVQECDGELSHFAELVEMIDASTCDPAAPMAMELCDETRTREALCAAEYAYRRGFTEVGDLLASRMANPPEFDQTPASSVELVESDEDFPFIAAVDESQGDVEECKQFLELVDEQDHALDATIQADVVRGSRQSVQWTAVEYACHLGYVDVVKYLLKETAFKGTMPMKAKFQMLKAVRERSVRLGTIRRTSV